jgi:hypothetical protein
MYYIKNPIHISVINPINYNNISTYYFLGNVPKSIIQSAQNGIYNKKTNKMEWNKNDIQVLKDFYGTCWKYILSGEDKMELYSSFNVYNYIGSNEEFIDMSLLDSDITPSINPVTMSYKKINYTDFSIYPEDNLYDIRNKIYVITKIPIYRQFIFYYIGNQGPYYAYQIYINKIPYTINWKSILEKKDIHINGIGIDLYFEQNKKEITISSYDLFTLMEIKKRYISRIYVIDLDFILKEYQINQIIDKYQFDLLYYGFIIKYYPQLTPDMFKLVLNNSEKLYIDYNLLYDKQIGEQSIINKTYKYIDNVEDIAITNANINIIPDNITLYVNIRNIFDQYILNSIVNAMFISIVYNKREYRISKKYATIRNQNFVINNDLNTLVIFIQDIILTIKTDGNYDIHVSWKEEEKITFTNIIKKLSNHVNPIITNINNLGTSVFPNGGSLKLITDDIVFNMITSIIYYPFTFSLQDFNNLKSFFKIYEELNIIRTQGIQLSRVYSFVFYKGMINKLVNINYKWMFDEDIHFIGRYIRILHKSDKLQIEFNNIKTIEEFTIIKRYIFSLINQFVKDNKLKKNIIIDKNISLIRKLHDIDPKLYNIDDVNYSVLCQSTRQPIIYTEEEVKLLDKNVKTKLYKYWNFTNNKPTYYLCNKKYPYINFITDKHPSGYCLPCCKKLPDKPNTMVYKINKTCIEEKQYKTESSDNAYILGYGKLIEGRFTHIPTNLSILLPNYYIYGVKQTYDTDTNVGFINSIKYIFDDNVIHTLSDYVKTMEHYYTLANGKASVYKSSDELYIDMESNFIEKNNIFLTNIDMNLWMHIITDLIRIIYNVEIIKIVNDNDEFHLQTYQTIIPTNKISFIIIDDAGYNPITNKTTSIFESSLCYYLFHEDVNNITEIEKHGYDINTYLINNKNLCYGIIISKNELIMYIPIHETINRYNNISYECRPQPTNTREQLFTFIDELNISKNEYKNIEYKNSIIGIELIDKLRYYHYPINYFDGFDNTHELISIPYDPIDIDQSILKRKTIMELSHEGVHRKIYNSLYKLFLTEFANIIQKDKNTQIRKKLKDIIESTDITESKSIEKLINSLQLILTDYPIDLSIIQNFIEFAYFNMDNNIHISSFIDSSMFEFDYQLFRQLQNISNKNDLITKLKELMSPFILTDRNITNTNITNIYTNCSDGKEQFFCSQGKLIIPYDRIDNFYDVLADDIVNKSKRYILLKAKTGIFDYFNFIKRDNEYLDIF